MSLVSAAFAVRPLPRGSLLALLLVGVFLALAWPQPAEAQMTRVIGGVSRTISDSWKRIVSEPQRFRIRPTLVIDPQRQAGDVTALSGDQSQRLVLAVHGNGAAHVWDLEHGVRIGGQLGDIISGVIRGAGRSAEIVVIHREGSASALRLSGEFRAVGAAIQGFDPRTAPALSGDGTTMAFRTHDGRWHVRTVDTLGTRLAALPGAAREAQPILSPDGSTIVYRATGGSLTAGRVTQAGVRIVGSLDGCGRGAPITASVFTPIGTRVVLGDARGRLCAWAFAGESAPKRLFAVPTQQLAGGVAALAMDRDGGRVAARGAGGLVEIWTVSGKIRRLATVRLSSGSARPLHLDTSRGWLFGGESDGTITIHSLEGGKPAAVGWLISTTQGWTVLDRLGRFDGSQSGIDALSWSGETATRIRQDLPVDAFSESYFEPRLLAKLAKRERADYLTAGVEDLSEDGYLRPPRVRIDPIPSAGRVAGEQVSVTVRQTEPDYPEKLLSDIRLYHNGKLVPNGRLSRTDGTARFRVRLAEGQNEFLARGVGYRGIEGPSSSPRTVNIAAPPPRPALRLVAVGIDDYARPDWELLYAKNDARTLVSAVRGSSRGLFHDVQTVALLDSSADKTTIEARILEAATSPHDVLVVYFSGHGYAFREKDGWEWYMLPFTNEWRRKATSQADYDARIRNFGLSSKRLMQLLGRSPAQRVFLVLDSCRSGAVVNAFEALSGSDDGVLDDSVAQKSLRRLARVGGIHVLAASRAQEDATELQVVPHGALTYLVIEGLSGNADGVSDHGRDGKVSVREIVDYAALEMPTLSHKLTQEPITQNPVGYSRGEDFALVEP